LVFKTRPREALIQRAYEGKKLLETGPGQRNQLSPWVEGNYNGFRAGGADKSFLLNLRGAASNAGSWCPNVLLPRGARETKDRDLGRG